MGTVRIVTDSLSWLPPEVTEEHRVEVVPLHVFFGEERYTETVNITNEQFYARLRTGDVLPKTSQPSPGRVSGGVRGVGERCGHRRHRLYYGLGKDQWHETTPRGRRRRPWQASA